MRIIARQVAGLVGGAVAVVLVSAWGAPAALAADSVYWTYNGTSGAIRLGALDGSGSPHNLGPNYANENQPSGIAIDPPAGKIYWADYAADTIMVGNLDGSGSPQILGPNYATEAGPQGLAIDPAHEKIYWANLVTGAIRVGNLDGSGSPQNLGPNFTSEVQPEGVTIDPAHNKIYWADYGSGAIRVGNLDGSGTPDFLGSNYTSENHPEGVAIDPAHNKIYWADYSSESIRVGNLDGSGTPQNLGPNYMSENGPTGVAIDPAHNKIYWTNYLPGGIRMGNLDGSGSPQNLGPNYGSEPYPTFLALLRSPAGTGAPQITGSSRPRSTLTCSGGSWDGDQLGGFLFDAPRSVGYSWLLNGSAIPGAGGQTYVAEQPGSYTCQVTASNQAGSTTQTSAPFSVTSASPPPPPPPPPPASPVLSGLGVSPRSFVAASAGPSAVATLAKRKSRSGTVVSYGDSEAATTTFTVLRPAAGVRHGKACVKPPRTHNRGRRSKPCIRLVAVGSFTHRDTAGVNRFRFTGWVKGHKLVPAAYVLHAVARNTAGKSSSMLSAKFRVRKR